MSRKSGPIEISEKMNPSMYIVFNYLVICTCLIVNINWFLLEMKLLSVRLQIIQSRKNDGDEVALKLLEKYERTPMAI